MRVEGYPDWNTDMKNPDFAMVAEAMGIRAWTVDKSPDLEKALSEAFHHDGPAVINIFTDPDALAMPPHVTLDQVKGFATSMAKMTFTGRTAEAIESASSDVKYLKELW